MAVYATKQDLIDRDEGMLWNFATDRDTNTLNDTWINQALEQADDEINSLLTKFALPLPTVPSLLNKQAIIIAFYWLADRDNQATDLLEKRYEKAIATLKEIASGKRDLGLPAADKPEETSIGKVEIVQDNTRMFTRDSLKGVL
ncbi:gp436 family protein [Vibrio gazogenes]|uniref:Mu-like prophage protein gp36 n=1 Tax=Vibrio gazogenes DSM 21264 = NBRC 103151 TaxID=1123492 RepID=A0A1M5F9S6_VIBGA|nr:DUF1320 domain-containing protein [Vibrio gazogenes]USP15468.1 DUF1320 domain-containing protein [Vibrio gazogenes]SHF88277.1 Mu-like prophage protein gp36 [Vibrio gazogenes DSM 21264] [Vibrio gazogenes DSM 21264 = NBRC 103151]SJN54546.1 hypothetical protein BQ6471_01071 [Vibrio gazogenes]HEG4440089.1 DUF1320 domain-containing protein [Vibrio cholerae]